MKRILGLFCIVLVMLSVNAYAGTTDVTETVDTITKYLPEYQTGLIFSLEEKEFEVCHTATLLKYPTKYGDIQLRGGWAVDEPLGVLAYRVGDLSDLGIEFALSDIIDLSVGVYGGYNLAREEVDYGLNLTVINLSW